MKEKEVSEQLVAMIALGPDDRINAPFPLLPVDLAMNSMPQDCIDAHGRSRPIWMKSMNGSLSLAGFWSGERRGMKIAITFIVRDSGDGVRSRHPSPISLT